MRRRYVSVGVLLIIIAAGASMLNNAVLKKYQPESQSGEGITPLSSLPAGYREYTSETHGFALWYPEEDSVRDIDDSGGVKTVVIENKSIPRGLQIFIVPYIESTISNERFRLDAPSGIRNNIAPAVVGKDNVSAVSFTGFDDALGETMEVWFIKNGRLYEITAFPGSEEWFHQILDSLRFF